MINVKTAKAIGLEIPPIGEPREVSVGTCKLLEELNEYRNYAAHDMLAYDTVLNKLVGSRAQRVSWKWLS